MPPVLCFSLTQRKLSNVQSALPHFAEKGSELPTKSGEGLFSSREGGLWARFS